MPSLCLFVICLQHVVLSLYLHASTCLLISTASPCKKIRKMVDAYNGMQTWVLYISLLMLRIAISAYWLQAWVLYIALLHLSPVRSYIKYAYLDTYRYCCCRQYKSILKIADVLRFPNIKQTMKQAFESSIGSLQRINEQFQRGIGRVRAFPFVLFVCLEHLP